MKRKIALIVLCLTALACAFSLSACSETKSLTVYVDGEVYQTIEFEGTEFVDLPELAERLGFQFMGWQMDNGMLIIDGKINASMANGAQNIHAIWNPINYIISYEMQGIGQVSNTPHNYFISDIDIPLSNPDYVEGYIFEGWLINGVGEPITDYVIEAGQTGDVNLVASWRKRDDILYKVEVYYEYSDTGYELDKTSNKFGTFDELIELVPEDCVDDIRDLEHRELDTNLSVLSGTVPSELEEPMVLKIYYKLEYVSVYFDFAGGADGLSTERTTTVKYGSKSYAVPRPTKTGYTFIGYCDETNTFYHIDGMHSVRANGDKVFTARYIEATDTPYSITVYKQNVDGTYSVAKSHTGKGTTNGTVSLTSHNIKYDYGIDAPNHYFDQDKSVISGVIAADGSLELKLYYTFIEVTATFDANGGEFENGETFISTTLKKGQYLTFPEVSRQGWIFKWWKDGNSIIEPYEFDKYDLHYDKNLVACWEEDFVDYTVNYFYQKLDGAYELKKTETSRGKTNSTIIYSEPGYKTDYMELNNELTTPSTTTINGDGSTIVNVYYSLKYYTITFNGNGGATEGGQTEVKYSVRYGLEFSEEYPEFIREHYEFNGWNYTLNHAITDNLVIKATWTAIEYAINYELDGGENYINNPEFITADYTKIILNDATKKGYKFLGWTVDGVLDEPTKTLNLITCGIKEHTVRANFELINYTITYTPADIIFSNPNPVSFTILDDVITLLPITDYDEGYTFKKFTYGGYEITEINPSRAASITITCVFEEYTLGNIQLAEIEKFSNGYYYKGAAEHLCKYVFDATKDFEPQVFNATCIDSEGNPVEVSVRYPDDWSWPNKAESITFVATNRGKTIERKINIAALSEANIAIEENNYGTDYVTMYELENYSGGLLYSNCLGLIYSSGDFYTTVSVSKVEYYYRPDADVQEYVKVDEITKSGIYKFVFTFRNLAGGKTLFEHEYNVIGEDDGFIITYNESRNIKAGLNYADAINLSVKDVFDRYPSVASELYSGEYKAGSKCRFKFTITAYATDNYKIDYDGLKTEFITEELTVYGTPTINMKDGLIVHDEDYTTYFEAFDTYNQPLEITYKLSGEYKLYKYVQIKATVTDAAGNTATVTKYGNVSFKEFQCGYDGKVVKYIGNSDTVIFPDGAEYIYRESGVNMFDDPTSIKKIVVPNSVTKFSIGILKDCTALEELSIPFIGSIRHDFASYYSGTKGGSLFNLFTSNVTDKAVGLESIPETLKKLSITYTFRWYVSGSYSFGIGGLLKNIEELNITTLDGSTPNVLGGSTKLKKVVFDVSQVGSKALKDCTALTTVELSDKVTSIKDYAFSGCTALESITIPSTVTEIGAYAFSGCTNLKEVIITGDKLETLGEYAFKDCVSLTALPNLKSVKVFDKAFAGCTGLPSTLTIPTGFTSAAGAFSGLTQIKEITFEDGVTEVSGVAEMFTDMPDTWRLEKVVLPSSVKSIDSYTFEGMPIVSVICNGTIENIWYGAFADCVYLTNVVYNGGVKNVTHAAFKGCVSLTEQNLAGVEYISNEAYYGCTSLKDVNFGNVLEGIGASAFENCGKLTQIDLPNTLSYIGNCAFRNTNLQSLTLTEGITQVEYDAFANCIALTEITIPSTLTTGGHGVFSGCVNIKEVTVAPRQSIGAQISNMFDQVEIERLYLPDGLVEIGDYAFKNLYWLTEIVIPSTVTKIGMYAFSSCRAPIVWENPTIKSFINYTFANYIGQTLTMPSSLETIGYDDTGYYNSSVFEGCTTTIDWGDSQVVGIGPYSFMGYLGTSITIPDSVMSIGQRAFENATNLESIIISGNTTLGNGVFSTCTNLVEVRIGEGIETLDETYTSNFVGVKNIYLPASLTTIGDSAFYDSTIENVQIANNSNLQTIGANAFAFSSLTNFEILSMASGVGTSAGAKAFYSCANLTSVLLPSPIAYGDNCFAKSTNLSRVIATDGLTSVGVNCFANTAIDRITLNGVSTLPEGIFSGCTMLTTVVLSDNLTLISPNVFNGCTALASVNIPSTVQGLPSNLFSGCISLTSIEIPGSINALPTNLFDGCTSLSSVKLNEGLTTINDYAFNGCTKLLSLEIPSTVSTLTAAAFSGCYAEISWVSPIIKKITGFNGYLGETINIPSSATSVLGEAFSGTYATIDWGTSNVSSLAYKAFLGYKGESVSVPVNISSIGSSPFYGYYGKVYWMEGSKYEIIEKDNFYGFRGEMFLPNSVKEVAQYGLRDCYGKINWIGTPAIKEFNRRAFIEFAGELVIPSSVTNFNYTAFEGSEMKKIYAQSLEQWCSIKFNGDSSHPAYVDCEIIIGGKPISEMDLSANGLVIGDYAFYKQNFTSITLGDNAVVGVMAFANNAMLETVTFGNNVQLNYLAFSECTALKNIEFGDSVALLGNAFTGCTSLTEVDLPTDYIAAGAFENCTSLAKVTYQHTSNLYIGDYAFANCALITDIYVKNAEIGNYAFSGCTGLTEVDLTNSSVGDCAFSGCTSLTRVNLLGAIHTGETSVFDGCPIKSIVIDYSTNMSAESIPDKSYMESIFVYYTYDNYVNDPEINLTVGTLIDRFKNDTTELYFYSENQPTTATEYKCWHFTESGEVKIWETV